MSNLNKLKNKNQQVFKNGNNNLKINKKKKNSVGNSLQNAFSSN